MSNIFIKTSEELFYKCKEIGFDKVASFLQNDLSFKNKKELEDYLYNFGIVLETDIRANTEKITEIIKECYDFAEQLEKI